ncbi:hypothetical protein [Marinobacter subterrani]|uniref:Uncharacterized protein n=1 Tax=Marinobacter subterrani TaxID=1658765 RepID=A0A0J7J5A3_9GAMM|nr:hypothetical protein [Marinobacter subterrani]KMQ73763.1 hypothetical protein Msub_20984 [Marinobacter subterrani]KMQ75354.1 hypothetical protein Msub_11556 [Marinobacter subterrani]KMQ76992.1 hypothetical protein Msub_13207 [Marinobacter subterrani]
MSEQPKKPMGTQATITIEATDQGVQVGLSFADKYRGLGSDETAVQHLALVGVEAIRDAIHEMFKVKEEQLLRPVATTKSH